MSSIEDADGVYTATVIDAVVENGKARFTARVTSSTIYYAHAGDTFTWTVTDSGEGVSATTPDSFTFNSAVLGGQPYTPARRHAVLHHFGQHPGPLRKLIRPRTRSDAPPQRPRLTQPGALVAFDRQS